jgi:hypothetical protein
MNEINNNNIDVLIFNDYLHTNFITMIFNDYWKYIVVNFNTNSIQQITLNTLMVL